MYTTLLLRLMANLCEEDPSPTRSVGGPDMYAPRQHQVGRAGAAHNRAMIQISYKICASRHAQDDQHSSRDLQEEFSGGMSSPDAAAMQPSDCSEALRRCALLARGRHPKWRDLSGEVRSAP